MTRRPKRAKAARKAGRKRASARREPTRTSRDPLDNFIVAGARALDLSIEPGWMAAVRTHLKVTLGHGMKVAAFALPDEMEPAPVFEA
jgi:hypothetical protein